METLARYLPPRIKEVGNNLLVRTKAGRRIVFSRYARVNRWKDPDSVSGAGSTLASTQTIRRELPHLFRRFGISTLLDVPCGDGNWMRLTEHELDCYIGADIVPHLIERLDVENSGTNVKFLCLDAIGDPLPRVDAILSRDFFIHLSNWHIMKTVDNMRRSGSRYLITSTFPGERNRNIATGQWRPVDLTREPFNFGPPLWQVIEDTQPHQDYPKALGMWELESLQPESNLSSEGGPTPH
jgi:hypothetical protein